jgi:uncharacterized protein
MLRGNRWLYEQVTQHCPDFVVADTLPELVAKMNGLVGDGSVRPRRRHRSHFAL